MIRPGGRYLAIPMVVPVTVCLWLLAGTTAVATTVTPSPIAQLGPRRSHRPARRAAADTVTDGLLGRTPGRTVATCNCQPTPIMCPGGDVLDYCGRRRLHLRVTDAYPEPEAHTDADAVEHADANADTDPDTDTDSDTNSDPNVDCAAAKDADPNLYAESNANTHTHDYEYAHIHDHSDQHQHADEHLHADPRSDADIDDMRVVCRSALLREWHLLRTRHPVRRGSVCAVRSIAPAVLWDHLF